MSLCQDSVVEQQPNTALVNFFTGAVQIQIFNALKLVNEIDNVRVRIKCISQRNVSDKCV
jgi:hypothetical protein